MLWHAETDAVLGRGLSDQHYRDASTRHHRKHASRHTNHALHAWAGDVNHRHIIQAGDTLHRHILIPAFLADQRTGSLWVSRVFIRQGIWNWAIGAIVRG